MFKKTRMAISGVKTGANLIKGAVSQIKDMDIKETVSSAKEKSLAEIRAEVQKAILSIFNEAKTGAVDYIDDDEKFIGIVDTIHEAFPFYVRVVVNKKQFRKLVLAARDKLRTNGRVTEEDAQKMAEESIQQEDF